MIKLPNVPIYTDVAVCTDTDMMHGETVTGIRLLSQAHECKQQTETVTLEHHSNQPSPPFSTHW